MSKKQSAGLLLYRKQTNGTIEVLIVHPGGPFWAKKDKAAWSIPKGEFQEEDDARQAAYREFEEEVGTVPPEGEPLALEPVKQPSGKTVYVWAIEGTIAISEPKSNTFTMEWPPKSGNEQEFPEVDKLLWCSPEVARRKLVVGQVSFIDQLLQLLGIHDAGDRQTTLF